MGRPYWAAEINRVVVLPSKEMLKPNMRDRQHRRSFFGRPAYYSERAAVVIGELLGLVEMGSGHWVKKLLIFGIVIVVLVVVYFTLYFIDVSGQILEVKWSKMIVDSVEEFDYTEKNLLKKGINSEQARDIINHPDRYRRVTFGFQFQNHSVWAAVANVQIEAHLPQDAKRRLVWMDHNIMKSYVGSAEKDRPDGFGAIFKLEEGDTEEDLKEICKQIRFTLTGKKVGFFDHGSITVPIQYRGD